LRSTRQTGHQFWKDSTGSAVLGPISAYSVNGIEYVALVVGQAGNQQTPNLPPSEGSRVIAYRLGNAPTIANDTTGQVALANAKNGVGGESEPPAKSTGSAPYTKQQVAQGSDVYGKDCAVCHGANLQGISAPALTGPGFGRSHLNASQLRTVVTQHDAAHGSRLAEARRICGGHGVHAELRLRTSGRRWTAVISDDRSAGPATGRIGRCHVPGQIMSAKHIGIVACSAEGAALCFREIAAYSQKLMGEHMHAAGDAQLYRPWRMDARIRSRRL